MEARLDGSLVPRKQSMITDGATRRDTVEFPADTLIISYVRRSVGQSILASGSHMELMTSSFFFCLTIS
jgi:hypothetical protein